MIVTAALIMGLLAVLAVRANARFRHEARLPMQWWLTGEVTWTAPCVIALAFIPALAAVVLGSQVILAATVAPRPGQEGLVFPVLIGTGALFVAIQLLHLWLVARTLRRR